MWNRFTLIVVLQLLILPDAFGQVVANDSSSLVFQDTVGSHIEIDSLNHDLGVIDPANYEEKVVKSFRYTGKKPILIERIWTQDPHFICQYPKGVLKPNQVYSITICFTHHQNAVGKIRKNIGFTLSDGTKVSMWFTGDYAQQKKE